MVDPRVVPTRADVLQAALDLLVEEDREGVRLPTVARRAGHPPSDRVLGTAVDAGVAGLALDPRA